MDGKTHFADDDTIRYIAKLQRERDTAMDERIAAGKRIEELQSKLDEREGWVCADCGNTGWQQNAVEGRYPCTCMTEAEPYQLLEQQRNELLAELERAQKWIAHRGNGLPDHACAQCVPHSDILIDGFVCAYHAAIAKVTQS